MLRCTGPSPFPKTPVIEKTILGSRKGKHTAYSPLLSTPLPWQTLPIDDSSPQTTHTATTSGLQSKHITEKKIFCLC